MAKKSTPVFKIYAQNQAMLLPPSLDELIAKGHPVRIVDEVIDKIDLTPLLNKYEGGGTSSYHPKMLLKVLVYSYVNNVYSSRKIEESVKENINFMWLAGMNRPDHNTINRFRGERLKDVLREIFVQVVELLVEEGLISLKEIYVDGTKFEANANKYTFVWGKSIKTNKEKMKKQLDDLWQYAQSIAAEEIDNPEPPDFTTIDRKKVNETIAKIDAALADKPVDKKVKQKLNYAKKNWPKNLEKYEEQEKILDGRNSYSKTDPDATFMRMKEDHMKNGQLKAGYNVQISTSKQFIVNYTLHPNPTDTTTLPHHLEQYEKDYNQKPSCVTADAGYGSQENYQYLEEREIEAFVKFNYFDKKQSPKFAAKYPFSVDTLHYNKERDCYYCPMGQEMSLIGTSKKKTSTGFEQIISRYQAKNCQGCPLRSSCHKSKSNRIIEINHELIKYKQMATEKLNSEEGIKHRKQRPVDVEPVFGNIKNNHHFKRFMLRRKEKVAVEFGLLALAQNIRKKAA